MSPKKRRWERNQLLCYPDPWEWDGLSPQEQLLEQKLWALKLTARYSAKDFLWLRRNWPGGIGTRFTLHGISTGQYAAAFERFGVTVETDRVTYPYLPLTQWADIWYERKAVETDTQWFWLLNDRTYEEQTDLLKALGRRQASVEQVLEYLLDSLLYDQLTRRIDQIPFGNLTSRVDSRSDFPSGDFDQLMIRCSNSVETPSYSPYRHELLVIVEAGCIKLDIAPHPIYFPHEKRKGVTMLMLKEVMNADEERK